MTDGTTGCVEGAAPVEAVIAGALLVVTAWRMHDQADLSVAMRMLGKALDVLTAEVEPEAGDADTPTLAAASEIAEQASCRSARPRVLPASPPTRAAGAPDRASARSDFGFQAGFQVSAGGGVNAAPAEAGQEVGD